MDEVAGRTPLIVVGVDGSDSSKDALRWAARQARLTGAELRAVTTWHVPAAAWPAGSPVPVDLADSSSEVLDEAIDEVLGEHPDIEVSRVVLESPPAPALLAEAEHADLLVVGSRGHGAFAGMLLGSVSQHCVTHAGCPVVVVRPKRVREEHPDSEEAGETDRESAAV